MKDGILILLIKRDLNRPIKLFCQLLHKFYYLETNQGAPQVSPSFGRAFLVKIGLFCIDFP